MVEELLPRKFGVHKLLRTERPDYGQPQNGSFKITSLLEYERPNLGGFRFLL